jgi:hypothetical protein
MQRSRHDNGGGNTQASTAQVSNASTPRLRHWRGSVRGGAMVGMVDVADVMAEPVAEQLLREVPILHRSYIGLDGGPRVIPIGYLWDGATFQFWTIPGAPKLRALQADPRVAITIDVNGVPPRVLFVRGRAALAMVDGVPAGYLEASHRGLPREQWAGFDAQVRSLYDRMVAITVTPEWAKLIDFDTTLPSAVERLLGERQHRE